MSEAYPNPFNPETEIRFQVGPSAGSGLRVILQVYDLLGKEVAVLMDEMLPAGWHTAKWNAERFASGTYLIRMSAGAFRAVRKIVLVR